MTKIQHLIEKIRNEPDCIVYPPSGSPQVLRMHVLPKDVAEFYKLCGGVNLYGSAPFGNRMVTPIGFVLANPAIRGMGITQEQLLSILPKSDISWDWYIIGEGFAGGDFITIDCSSERLGRCYDSFWETHADPGHTPIIASSFTELLNHLVSNRGQMHYWQMPGFQSLGDAYDPIGGNG